MISSFPTSLPQILVDIPCFGVGGGGGLVVTPVTGSQGWAAADRATADLGHAAQPSSSLQHSLFLSAAKHTWAHSQHPIHLSAPNIFADIKGCQLKNVPTGWVTAAYISEKSRNSK